MNGWVYLLDPDVGLLPNWPLGLAVVILALLTARTSGPSRQEIYRWAALAVCYVGISLLAQGVHLDLNAGGTPSFSRYAAWYIPLWFPLLVYLFRHIGRSVWLAAGIAAGAIATLIMAASMYDPKRDDQYLVPTQASLFVQTRLPWLDDPPPEIFAERYGGIREWYDLSTTAVLGPDCRKLLILDAQAAVRKFVGGAEECGLRQRQLSRLIQQKLMDGTWPSVPGPIYVRLNR